MSLGGVGYNERSWAIDLIGHLKHLASQNNRSIKDAGGEQTVKAEGGSLFPDVLLFGDRATARTRCLWLIPTSRQCISKRCFLMIVL